MTTIQRSADCANSPKNAFAEDVAVVLLTGTSVTLAPSLSDDATIEVVGKAARWGQGDLRDFFETALEANPQALRIEHALTHGKVGAVNGVLTTQDGADKGFCVMLTFASTKAKRVRTIQLYLP